MKIVVLGGDGSSTRDYIPISDLCDGIHSALVVDEAHNDIFQLASSRETSLLDLAAIRRRVAAKPQHPVECRDSRLGEVDKRKFTRFDHAREVPGLQPQVELEAGLGETCRCLNRFADSRSG